MGLGQGNLHFVILVALLHDEQGRLKNASRCDLAVHRETDFALDCQPALSTFGGDLAAAAAVTEEEES
jgi:hypothetical protein